MATDIEKIMIKILDNLGYRYYEQYELIPYIVDFYLPEFKIAIEADGKIWHSCMKDRERDIELMMRYKIRVLHFADETIKKLPITIAMSIQKEIDRTIYKESNDGV